ncbi:DUF5693 family protein [Calidifontibacillus oryziterrae]|uniref:DUF5693 family protein n=1 Tax=Calidifontibacillus oryziterrae TaxID=1191699 RepID=UPI0003688511|nr:DUF5693 family protein [Calidifontibacillus oryziterrae]
MKKILMAIVALSILLTAPLIYNRAKVEWQNDTYEMIVPYEEIRELENRGLDTGEMLSTLADLGVKGISFEPTGIQDLEKKGQVMTLTKSDLFSMLQNEDEVTRENVLYSRANGLYILLRNDLDERWERAILTTFKDRIEKVEDVPTLTGESLYFISGLNKQELLQGTTTVSNPILTKPIGYDEEVIAEYAAYGFEPVFRIGNNVSEANSFVLDQMKQLSDQFDAHKIVFTGNAMLGVSPHEDLEITDAEEYALRLKNEGFVLMPIEFTDQDGLQTYARTFQNKIVRLHSIDFFDGRGGYTDRATRAVKERNIRALYIHIADIKRLEAEMITADQSFEVATIGIDAIQEKMADKHQPGISQSYNILKSSTWMTLAALIGVAAFIAVAALMVSEKIALLTFGGMLVVAAGYIVTGSILFLQAAALAVSIVAATWAAITGEYINSKKEMVIKFVKAAAIALIGAWFVTALLYGNLFLVKIDEFRGVKLLFLLPIVLTGLHVIRDHVKELALAFTRNYYFIIFAVLAAGMAILLLRSGNDAGEIVSGAELMLRQGLEDLMFVRPRTKEFLIGYPLFVLAMFIIYQGKGWEQRIGKYLLAGGAIGFLSTVNTFTHLHIPLYISVLRTIYGFAIGALLGIVLIWMYKLGKKYWPLIQAKL